MPDLTEAMHRIDAAVESRMEQDGIPGLSLSITGRDRSLYDRAYGFATIESRMPVETSHLFEFGSIGKSFTCILLLQLQEEGRLDIHEPVASYLPWFEVQSEFEQVTLHHLMTHTAGIINGTDFPADSRFEVWSLRDTKATNPPGKHFHYSNVGYKALGLVLQAVNGQPYSRLVRERILDPLEMNDTDPSITHGTRKRLVTGYRPFYDDRPYQAGQGPVPATWLETDTADGCIAGTASDLARYLRMLMNGGDGPNGRILSPESFAAMTARHAPLAAADLGLESMDGGGYGYGLYSFSSDGRDYIGHSGGMVGYYAHMAADLTTGVGAVTTINGPGSQRSIVDYAIDVVRAALTGESLPDLPKASDPLAGSDAAAYAGTFRSPDGSIRITADGDELRIVAPEGSAPLELRGKDAFLALDAAFDPYLLNFERDSNGTIVAARHGSRSWSLDGRMSPDGGHPEIWTAYPGHYRSHNPWQTNFRIILRAGNLFIVSPWGSEEPLTDRGDGVFRIGDEQSPEFIRFDTIVNGEAWRAEMSGCDYYRFFTP